MDLGFQQLTERGEVHERSVLARFERAGFPVIQIPALGDTEAARATGQAVRDGVPVIYQGVLFKPSEDGGPDLIGRPDFLVRLDVLPSGADGIRDGEGYEVVDAKLAHGAKARAILQAVFYSRLLAATQGFSPALLHLALGNGAFSSFRVDDYAAYERQVRRLFVAFIKADPLDNPPLDPYPEPVEHCAICRWRADCVGRRHEDDDLSIVAGMPANQRKAMKVYGVATRRRFAGLATLPSFDGISAASLAKGQLQARLQVESEDQAAIRYQLLEPERAADGSLAPNLGLLALPQPNPGDLFFDIEGSRQYSEDDREFGIQYLFGIVDTAGSDGERNPQYIQMWAFDRAGEKQAFERLVDFIAERRQINPGLHVYHYNHYEPTSLEALTTIHETREETVGRLMGRFATHEQDVDNLFRGSVFVDLYRVIRQAMRVGVESYSIKRLEPLVGFRRRVDLSLATIGLLDFEASLDDGSAARNAESRLLVASYNEDDCRSTLALRDWLEARRPELAAKLGEEPPRPQPCSVESAAEGSEVAALGASLTAGLPADRESWDADGNARALLADLLEWHRRENKPGWWEYFRRKKLTTEELVMERKAIGELSGGRVIEERKGSLIRRLRFPPQEHGFEPGDIAEDPVTGSQWRIHGLDDARSTLDLRVGKGRQAPLPHALMEVGPVRTRAQEARLQELGQRAATRGISGDDPATALLLRRITRAERLTDTPLAGDSVNASDCAVAIIPNLRSSYLPIQGPPGTGKTYTAARAILALLASRRTVGVTGPSHAVIHNLLSGIVSQAGNRSIRIGQRADRDNPHLHSSAESLTHGQLLARLAEGSINVVAGTCWLWARSEFAGSVDTLFVDEAGQMSLANVLAIAGAARNLVLLGDPRQLAQPSQATHPPRAGASALEHVLDGKDTMPENQGLFLDITYRMHPTLCAFTSNAFYESRLHGVPGLERQILGGAGADLGPGLHTLEVNHEGNSSASPEEAEAVAALTAKLLSTRWTDRFGQTRPTTAADILVVTPYNSQIREITRAFGRGGVTGVRVGTVDKFQGQEAPVVIYSMATSTVAEAPRGMEFLYDLHRLNVATSRAQGLAIIVASPELIRVFCKTPRQMLLANALCRAWEN